MSLRWRALHEREQIEGDAIGRQQIVLEAAIAEQRKLEHALEHPVDFKSTLQELLATRGDVVLYEVTAELGPPHERTFEVRASVRSEELGSGSGRSKKAAEQEAARRAMERLERPDG